MGSTHRPPLFQIFEYMTYQIRVSMDDLLNTFPSESFLPESHLDVIENFSVRRDGLIQYVPEVKVSRTQTVAEVLSEDPAAACINADKFITALQIKAKRTRVGSLLYCMVRFAAFVEKEEGVIRKTEEQRYFFHDLKNGLLDWGGMRVRQRVKIERDDRNTVRELFWL
jgi:hypothetical protein